MNAEEALRLARRAELYPGLILHGSERAERIDTAVELGRTLLCERERDRRPCGECRHCRRITPPDPKAVTFHPDFFVLERDLLTSTSVEAVKTVLRSAQLRPFEARGQVFVIADAETLSGGAANSLLKNLEEPPTSAPRHFLLLAPSAVELLPTLRSRCMAIYLGLSGAFDPEGAWRESLDRLEAAIKGYAETGSPVLLLAAARVLFEASSWDQPRSGRPWSQSAWLVTELAKGLPRGRLRRQLLQAAEELLEGIDLRVRSVPAQRILEGVLSRSLAGI